MLGAGSVSNGLLNRKAAEQRIIELSHESEHDNRGSDLQFI